MRRALLAHLLSLALVGVLSSACASKASRPLTDTAPPAPPEAQEAGSEANVGCGDISSDPLECGRCGHNCLGGACVASVCQPVVLAPSLQGPAALAIDDANVYWTEPETGQVKSIDKRGGASAILASGLSKPGAITVDSGYVYWAEDTTIRRVPVGGGTPSTIASSLQEPIAIAVDAGDIYFSTVLDQTLWHLTGAGPPVAVYSGQTVLSLALDSAKVYGGTVPAGVFALSRKDGHVQTLAAASFTSPDSGLADYTLLQIALSATNVYWTEWATFSNLVPSLVLAAPVDGGTVTTLCAACASALAIAVDSSGVYLTESAGVGDIVALRGGAPTVLATGQLHPQSIATDSNSIYWLNFGDSPTAAVPSPSDGAIVRLAK